MSKGEAILKIKLCSDGYYALCLTVGDKVATRLVQNNWKNTPPITTASYFMKEVIESMACEIEKQL